MNRILAVLILAALTSCAASDATPLKRRQKRDTRAAARAEARLDPYPRAAPSPALVELARDVAALRIDVERAMVERAQVDKSREIAAGVRAAAAKAL